MVSTIHQREQEMLFLTPKEKRERIISEAVILFMKDEENWFVEIRKRIDNGILANPGKKEQVIVKWIISAEESKSNEVKNQILYEYNQRKAGS